MSVNRYDPATGTLIPVSGTNNHLIVDENGTTYPARAKLKFVNATVTDDSTNDTTIVEAEGGGGGGDVDELMDMFVNNDYYATLSDDDDTGIIDDDGIEVAGDWKYIIL